LERGMANRFGMLLHPDDVRWAAAEDVSEDVIAAVLLLHERSVDEIVPKLSAAELEQVIKLVGRSPSVYPPGTLDALKQWRTSIPLAITVKRPSHVPGADMILKARMPHWTSSAAGKP
jgi:hypothetical protein